MYLQRCLSVALTFLLGGALVGPCRGDERSAGPSVEIVVSVMKAYGGADTLRKVRSVTATGRIFEFLNGTSGSYSRYLERPGKLRIEVMPERGGEIRILDGNQGWQMGSSGFQPVSTLEIQSMMYQYCYLSLPMGFADGEYQATYGGTARHNGREVYLLLVESKPTPSVRILIDAKSRLIARVSANFETGMMGAGELATEYSDYRVAGGVLFPHKLTNYAGDMKLSEIVLTDIQLNRQLPSSLFAPE